MRTPIIAVGAVVAAWWICRQIDDARGITHPDAEALAWTDATGVVTPRPTGWEHRTCVPISWHQDEVSGLQSRVTLLEERIDQLLDRLGAVQS